MGLLKYVGAVLAAHSAFALPTHDQRQYEVKETHILPKRWQNLGRAPADRIIDLQIGVRQGNFEELEKRLYEVSHPDHPSYGKHLTQDDVNELVKPDEETLELVLEWLREHDIVPASYSSAKDWIMVSLPVSKVERLLDTKYHIFEHENGNQAVRTLEWSLPAHLHEHIETIQPTTSFFRAHAQGVDHVVDDVTAAVSSMATHKQAGGDEISKLCNVSSVTPQCFETLYKTKGYQVRAAGKNQVGFTNYLGEHPIRSDLALFLSRFRPYAVSVAQTFKQFVIADGPGDGPLLPGDLSDGTSKEANLDVQAISGINWGTPLFSYSTGGSPPFDPSASTPDNTNEPYLVWVNWLLDQKSFPQVISTSYSDDEQTVPRSYAERVCKQFAAVGARGTTLLFASGDFGVGSFDPDECISNDGKNTTKFLPNFPPSCPYVTVVGATKEFSPEVVAWRPEFTGPDGVHHGNWSSGSGFSNYFSTPSYQKKEVAKYVKGLHGKHDGLYNKHGRGYPDISAQGFYFSYFWNGTEGVISGTSASTPLTAGIISLVNDALLASGKPALGFLNPWLYAKGHKGFTDITIGTPYGCGTDGFPATKGWDPVTGFGTPDFPKLVKVAGGKLH
ncbi:tripeptidyl-peptidase 1 precursor [Stachybotrys elegans]|uniref:tripeptidyl-peptidase II n=1 Tax=Stachybotrys elegans TaxID=80388 RepID=A0A8K0SL28_9HYPO|nr:tripeptidyl-peptidase 1 precursor [Stachybotrys elegans]